MTRAWQLWTCEFQVTWKAHESLSEAQPLFVASGRAEPQLLRMPACSFLSRASIRLVGPNASEALQRPRTLFVAAGLAETQVLRMAAWFFQVQTRVRTLSDQT